MIAMEKSCVAVVACPDYERRQVRQAVNRGLELLGGAGQFAGRGEKILLKPNLLSDTPPERAVTTHPSLLRAVAEAMLQQGAVVSMGDSPGLATPQRALARSGIMAEVEDLGLALADFERAEKVSFSEAVVAKQLFLARGALENDGIISLAKMKTHGLTRITGAVKNTFGCIPGLRKSEFHVKMPEADHFSTMLVDVNRYLRPRLHILDGIIAMEGNGPRGGTRRHMGVLLFSRDPLALDSVFCHLIHLNPELVPFMKPGAETGLGRFRLEEIEMKGDDAGKLRQVDFAVKRQPQSAIPRKIPLFVKNWFIPRPLIDPLRCSNCGTCIAVCPVSPQAVNRPHDVAQALPAYDYQRCIRCYCCQESCPESAITIVTPPLGRLIHHK